VPTAHRSPKLGYLLAAIAAALWALNGSLARFLLDDHLPPARLAELRSVGTFVAIMAVLVVFRPRLLRVIPRDIPRLALLGVVGLAGVTAFYFAAIARLDIGVALTVQYLGPLLVLVWLKVAHRRTLPGRLWGAAALSALGCFLVVRAYSPGSIDGLGLLAALGAAVTFAVYLFTSEQAGQRYPPATVIAWGFGLSSLFWVITQPVWSFPTEGLSSSRNLAFAAYIVIGGTLVPFACIFAAVRHLPASRAAVVATLEPVLGALLAWPIQGQGLSSVQIAGGLAVLSAVIWVQLQRPPLETELAPAYGTRRGGRRLSPQEPHGEAAARRLSPQEPHGAAAARRPSPQEPPAAPAAPQTGSLVE
jgi:drug/metabolite transporter (DMT)-like permease